MTGKTHAAVSMALTSPFIRISEPKTFILIPFALFGSLIPDVDADYSLAESASYTFIFIVTAFILIYSSNNKVTIYAIVALIVLSILGKCTEHRTVMHSIMGMLVFLVPIVLISPYGAIPFAMGYITHLIGDYYTGDGIKLLFPKQKRYGKRLFYNQSKDDRSIRFTFIMMTIIILLYSLK
jgi:inner membrane protein